MPVGKRPRRRRNLQKIDNKLEMMNGMNKWPKRDDREKKEKKTHNTEQVIRNKAQTE